MAETINSLEDLGTTSAAAPVAAAAPVHVQKIDKEGRAYATGKRKNAIARVWIKPGNGKITVNGKEFAAFFARPVLQMILQQPIVAAARKDQYDVVATVAEGETALPVRFEATLAEAQKLTISVPGRMGEKSRSFEISRVGGKLTFLEPLLMIEDAVAGAQALAR